MRWAVHVARMGEKRNTKSCTCFEMGSPLRWEETSDYYWSLPFHTGRLQRALTDWLALNWRLFGSGKFLQALTSTVITWFRVPRDSRPYFTASRILQWLGYVVQLSFRNGLHSEYDISILNI
jgi:hypothetical protein